VPGIGGVAVVDPMNIMLLGYGFARFLMKSEPVEEILHQSPGKPPPCYGE
jgi:hypothetical protein